MLSLTIDYDEVRLLANDAAQNNFFRGLVSTRLGSDRILDEELVDLIATNQLLGEILDEFCNSEAGRAKIKMAIAETFPELPISGEGGDYEPIEIHVCRLVWMQTVNDPRFDIVLKQALDDSKLPPPVVRGSGLSRVMGLLDKIRAALSSGTTKHTDAVLAASIIAALLAGGAGVKVFNSINAPSAATADKASIEAIARDLHTIAGELHTQDLHDQQITNLESQVTQRNEAITNLQQEFNTQYADLSKRITSTSTSQIEQLQTSVATLSNSLAKTNDNLSLTNNNVKKLQDQISLAEQVKESLQQIADGIGPPKEKDSNLPSLRASSQQIAVDLAPADDTSKDSTKDSHDATASPKQTPAGTSSSRTTPAGSTIAASLKALENDAQTTEKTYLGIQPVAFFGEFSITMTQSNATLKRVDGQNCQVTWTLISASSQSAIIALNSNDCQIGLPNNARIVLDHTRRRLPGTNLELSFGRPDQTRFWPLSPKGAVIAVYQNPLLPQ